MTSYLGRCEKEITSEVDANLKTRIAHVHDSAINDQKHLDRSGPSTLKNQNLCLSVCVRGVCVPGLHVYARRNDRAVLQS